MSRAEDPLSIHPTVKALLDAAEIAERDGVMDKRRAAELVLGLEGVRKNLPQPRPIAETTRVAQVTLDIGRKYFGIDPNARSKGTAFVPFAPQRTPQKQAPASNKVWGLFRKHRKEVSE